MEPMLKIKNAFLDAKGRLRYYNLMNNLFRESSAQLLHDACTIQAAKMCLLLKETHGFSTISIYLCVRELFSEPSTLRLSELVDISSYQSFVDSLSSIENRVQLLEQPKMNSYDQQFD